MRSSVKPYDSHWLWGTLFALIGMGLAMRFTAGVAFFLIFPMILVGFGKNRTELLLFCLMLDIAMVMSNSNVIPKSGAFSIAARLVYFLVAGVMVMQMTAQRRSRLLGPMLGILVYLVFFALLYPLLAPAEKNIQAMGLGFQAIITTFFMLGINSCLHLLEPKLPLLQNKALTQMLQVYAFICILIVLVSLNNLPEGILSLAL